MVSSTAEMPWWFTSTFSILLGAVVGIFSGLVGQWFVADWLGGYRMRRVLYRDLAQMFLVVDKFMNMEPSLSEMSAWGSDPLLWQQHQFKKRLWFRGEKYCLDNAAIYMQLPERFAGETLYRCFRCILEDPASAIPLNTRTAADLFALYIDDGVLKPRYFKCFCRKNVAQVLLRRAKELADRQRIMRSEQRGVLREE
jgi:hypothetical protein